MLRIKDKDDTITKIVKLIELGKSDEIIQKELEFESMDSYIEFFNTHKKEIQKMILPINRNA